MRGEECRAEKEGEGFGECVKPVSAIPAVRYSAIPAVRYRALYSYASLVDWLPSVPVSGAYVTVVARFSEFEMLEVIVNVPPYWR